MPATSQTFPRLPPGGRPAEADWGAARGRMMLDPSVAYLNAGSAGPLSHTVFDCVTGFRRHLAEEPIDFLLRRVPPLLWAAREQLAAHVGGDPPL